MRRMAVQYLPILVGVVTFWVLLVSLIPFAVTEKGWTGTLGGIWAGAAGGGVLGAGIAWFVGGVGIAALGTAIGIAAWPLIGVGAIVGGVLGGGLGSGWTIYRLLQSPGSFEISWSALFVLVLLAVAAAVAAWWAVRRLIEWRGLASRAEP